MAAFVLIPGVLLPGMAMASIATELGDAGYLTGTAQTVAAGTTQINGLGGTNGDIDMFRFTWGGGDLTMSTSGSGDPALYLFNSAGIGLVANDDISLGDYRSQIEVSGLAAGDYFVAIQTCCYAPLSNSGAIFFGAVGPGQVAANGPGAANPMTGWAYLGIPGVGTDPYTISFSAASEIPEPGTLALAGLAIAGLAASRRRRSS